MRSFASPRSHSDFDTARRAARDQAGASRFGRRLAIDTTSASVKRPAHRDSVGRGLDGWTIFLLGALVAGIMGMMLGGVLSV